MTFEVHAEYFHVIVLDEDSRYDFSDARTDAASERRIAPFPGGLLLGTATDRVAEILGRVRGRPVPLGAGRDGLRADRLPDRRAVRSGRQASCAA